MFNRIRTYFDNRRLKKKIDKTVDALGNLSFSPMGAQPAQELFAITGQAHEASLMFTGNDGEEIFCISNTGEAKWLKEDSYNEAADMFLHYMTMNIEDRAGIIQNRREWENRIAMALVSEAEKAPLGPGELTDVLRKCIMYDKLKGIKD